MVKKGGKRVKEKIASLTMVMLLIISVLDFMAIIFIASVVSSDGSTDWWLMFRHDISQQYFHQSQPRRRISSANFMEHYRT
jgi:hypothetical protein